MSDRNQLIASVDSGGETAHNGEVQRQFSPAEGAAGLAARPARTDLKRDPDLPAETRLWAALQGVGGGTWGGCVYDVERILGAIHSASSTGSAEGDKTST